MSEATKEHTPTWYRCGCCGSDFLSSAGQDDDHDAGYGICPGCETWIGKKEQAEWERMRDMVANALNPRNQAKFLAMEPELQRGVVGHMIDDGILTWTIGAAS